MRQETYRAGWAITDGDYRRDTEYDEFYIRSKKKEKIFRGFIWLGAVAVIALFFTRVLAFASRM